MASNNERARDATWRCGSYRLGHDVHFIQVRLSLEDGPGVAGTVAAVHDDGTIELADGTTLWHHDPRRRRAVLDQCENRVILGSTGVLRVPHDDDDVTACFSVSTTPDPCRPETSEVRPGESILDELLRRGGVIRSLESVREELDMEPGATD